MFRKLVVAVFVLQAVNVACHKPPGKDREQMSGLTARFFTAIAKKDLFSAMALWEAGSPQFVSAREDLRRLFGANRITLARGRVERTTFSGIDRARTYLHTDIEAFAYANGGLADGFGHKDKLIDWVRQARAWKILRYAPAEAELADALMAARNKDDRARLRAASPQWFNSDLIHLLCEQASQAARNGRPDDAARFSDIAIESATYLGDSAALGWADLCQAAIRLERSDSAAAEPLAQRALDLSLKIKERRLEAAAHNLLGSIYSRRSEFDAAARELETSLGLAKQTSDPSGEGAAQGSLGEVQRRRGNLDAALQSFESSQKIYQTLGDRKGEVLARAHIAKVFFMRNENQKALDLYRQCIAIDEELQDKLLEGSDVGDLGTLLEAMSRYPEAIEALEKSMRFRRETGDREGEAKTLNNLGIVFMETGKLRPALATYAQSLGLAAAIKDQRLQGMVVSNEGTVYQLLGEYGKALIAFQESLRLADASHNAIGSAISKCMIATLYTSIGRYSEALDLFAQTLPFFEKEGMRLEQETSLQNMAEIYQKTGKYGEAAAGYRESLRIKRAIHDSYGELATLNALADLYRMQGHWQESIETARQGAKLAYEITSPLAEALNTLAMADSLQLAGQPGESEKAYGAALQIARNIGAQDAVAAAYTGLGAVRAAQHDWTQAAANCANAINAVELMRAGLPEPSLQIGFFGLNQKPYHCLLSSLLALHKNEEALETAERARARTLIEVLGRAQVDIYEGLKAEDRQKLQQLDSKVEELEFAFRQSSSLELLPALKTARQARDDFERVLYLQAPTLAVKRGRAGTLNWADLKTILPDSHAALLEYTMGEAQSWLFVLRGPSKPGGAPVLFVHALPSGRQRIAKLVHSYWERLSKGAVESSEGGELYQLLLGPARDELAAVSSLGIVPDGSLWLLPFAALREPGGRYVVESKAIYYAPSLTALGLMAGVAEHRRAEFEARLRTGPPPFLLVGDPSFGAPRNLTLPLRGHFSELPETAAEVKGIAGLPGVRADVLLGREASEDRVKEQSSRYPLIHFATHGIYDSTNPMYSGILLSQTPNSREDGFWEAREIAQQTLNTELVVVSACDTARGEIFAGEGVMGLSWALFVAGTPSSLLTTWPVNDKSTSLLMREFYRQWGVGGPNPTHTSKAAALQQSQKWMLSQKHYANPYFWAPFVLIGSPR